MKMIFIIAWRNVWRNQVRSLIIILSVIIGLWAGTFVNAIYWGMTEDRVRIVIESEISHLQIHHPQFSEDQKAEYTLPLHTGLIQTLEKQKNIKAFSVRSIAPAMLATATGSTGLNIKGISPATEDQTTHLSTKLIEGSYFPEGRKNTILVGAKLAKKMKLKIKSKVVLTFLDKEGNIVSASFKVSGIFRSNNEVWDERYVFVRSTELDPLLGLQREAHEVAILLQSQQVLPNALITLRTTFPQLLVQGWDEVSPDTGFIVSYMSKFSLIFITIILLALSFGIVNTMLMAILERGREIGMMVALGMNKMRIFFMVLLETTLLVLLGCPIGLFIAWLTINYFSRHGIDISSFSSQAMSSFGFSSIIYPRMQIDQYIQIIILVCITALVSAIFPAIKALRIYPASAIKM